MATRHSRRLQNRSPEPVTGPVSDHEPLLDSDRATSDSDPELPESDPVPSDSEAVSDSSSDPTFPHHSPFIPATIPPSQPKPLPPCTTPFCPPARRRLLIRRFL